MATANPNSTQQPKNNPFDCLVNITAQLRAIKEQSWNGCDDKNKTELAAACDGAAAVIGDFLDGDVIDASIAGDQTESAQSFLTDPHNPRITLEDMQRMIAMLQALDFSECVSEDALMGEHIILGEISKAMSDLDRLCTINPKVETARA
ncbi:MAG: hypothetical protein IIA11_05755 [Proteobacteria bacterium]|nr:hypothetical protein [Pseudomonadota bacterium]